VFLISLFQIWPDWFLSAQLNILVFPDDGLFKIGTVSGYMAGLWAIPLFLICFIGLKLQEKYSHCKTLIAVGLISLTIFGFSEQSMWMLQSWYPQNVTLIFDHLAVYIIIPEIILGLSTFYTLLNVNCCRFWYNVIVSWERIIFLLSFRESNFYLNILFRIK